MVNTIDRSVLRLGDQARKARPASGLGMMLFAQVRENGHMKLEQMETFDAFGCGELG
jgi:hypothetical protein